MTADSTFGHLGHRQPTPPPVPLVRPGPYLNGVLPLRYLLDGGLLRVEFRSPLAHQPHLGARTGTSVLVEGKVEGRDPGPKEKKEEKEGTSARAICTRGIDREKRTR